MACSVGLVIFLQLILTIVNCNSLPLTESPLKVIVNNTNFNHRDVSKIITNGPLIFEPPPLPEGNFKSNDVKFGKCVDRQQIVHNENLKIESLGPSTLSGIFEFYIDSPIRITCIEVLDKMPPGTGATVTLHSGGPGYNWFFLNAQGKYARGMHLMITAFGIPDYGKIIFRKERETLQFQALVNS